MVNLTTEHLVRSSPDHYFITSKKNMANRAETTRYVMLFFEVLPFTNKKNNAASFGVSRP